MAQLEAEHQRLKDEEIEKLAVSSKLSPSDQRFIGKLAGNGLMLYLWQVQHQLVSTPIQIYKLLKRIGKQTN
jgi:hypothetical protein